MSPCHMTASHTVTPPTTNYTSLIVNAINGWIKSRTQDTLPSNTIDELPRCLHSRGQHYTHPHTSTPRSRIDPLSLARWWVILPAHFCIDILEVSSFAQAHDQIVVFYIPDSSASTAAASSPLCINNAWRAWSSGNPMSNSPCKAGWT